MIEHWESDDEQVTSLEQNSKSRHQSKPFQPQELQYLTPKSFKSLFTMHFASSLVDRCPPLLQTLKILMERWIDGDENANQMLARVFMARPFLLPPPLHRVPLRVGNVVELIGPSPSGKTHILTQTAISCILPKRWNDVEYGGLDRLVVFVDLDCRFDITRLSEMLNYRIMEVEGAVDGDHNKTLYNLCMSRFLYIHCYNSFEFLQTLKTLHYRLQKEEEAHGVSSLMLMIDSIGAFHWIDRATAFLPSRDGSRKNLFPQTVSEAVVQEIKKVTQMHPMLIIATKSAIFMDRCSTPSNVAKWNFIKDDRQTERVSKNVTRNDQPIQYREYMPSVWQAFVTHRILVRASDDYRVMSNHENCSFYTLGWLLPRMNSSERLVVKDVRSQCTDHGFDFGGFFIRLDSDWTGLDLILLCVWTYRQEYLLIDACFLGCDAELLCNCR